MGSIFDRIPKMSDPELRVLQRNAREITEKKPGTSQSAEAERVLSTVENELARRHLPGMIARFTKDFPQGFDDPKHISTEREYKVDAANYCRTQVGIDDFELLNEPKSQQELLKRVRRLVQMTNMLQPSFEVPKFFDKVAEPTVTAPFLQALRELMWGQAEPEIRLERFADVVEPWGLRKWTYCTYFLFVSHPESCMFVKPTSMERALDFSPYPLTYDSRPSADLYRGILNFARWLQSRLSDLHPKDMIDIQSFIWFMAPTGIHADNEGTNAAHHWEDH